MAGANESPRQKMINLMYLVFIAMLALNMSKEVLTAFGLISEQVEKNNGDIVKRIGEFNKLIDNGFNAQDSILTSTTSKDVNIWTKKKAAADSINLITAEFINTIESLKNPIKNTKEVDVVGKDSTFTIMDYETMDKAEYWNGKLFDQDKGLNENGENFLKAINNYVASFQSIALSQKEIGSIDTTYEEIAESVTNAFETKPVIDGEGIEKTWMEYHLFGYPEVSTNTKLTIMKANALNYQASLLSALIGGQYKMESELTNFDAYVISDRSGYYTGSEYTGRVVLGKKSNSLVPSSIIINGESVPLTSVVNGEILLNFPAGNSVKEHDITGEITFIQDGKEIAIDVNQTYKVIKKPNSASVEVIGRNTLFRNYPNEVYISVPGVNSGSLVIGPSNLVTKSNKSGYYFVKPAGGSELDLSISATLQNGDKFSDTKKFFIRRAPAPDIYFNSSEGGKMSKSAISGGAVSAVYPAAYGISKTVTVASFDVKMGNRNFKCEGDELSSKAKKYLRTVKKNTDIIIKNIEYIGITVGNKTNGVTLTVK
ncbi:MAG: Uncharacterised protein [Formosa sp. Hel1_33_131]|nr:MAG: Uncharacterised protein [Formosa sp. Hel1_33_131]|tara:strand:+ start:7013 stop:8638 length:1626 start_codon:yes stop_codon:yes gene_type:complete